VPDFRLFAVNSTGDLTLQETTVSGGRVSSDPVTSVRFLGGGITNYDGTVTVTNSTISSNSAYGAGGVFSRGGLLTVINSTITGNSAYGVGGGVGDSFGTVTVTNSTIAANSAVFGGGVANSPYSTVTVTNSIISSNSASSTGGGVHNFGTVTVINSTITGNSAGGNGGGVRNFGTVTVTNSTISSNSAYVAGGVSNGGYATITLVRTLIAGNIAPSGFFPEIGGGTVLADNHNLFGVDGTAGVGSFTPGATDVVPPAGIQLADILNPTLALNGGPTQTHALVPGSPAIDAGDTDCTDANGDSLPTDQRGRPRVVDGNGDGTVACDIGAFEFFPIVNTLVALAGDVDTAFDATPVANGPAGTFTITATFTNTSDTPLRFPFFIVTELSGGNLLLKADEGTMGVGATLTPDVGDSVLAPGEAMVVDFVIGLQVRAPFTFFVDLFGEPLL
jgi:hypothetical protein